MRTLLTLFVLSLVPSLARAEAPAASAPLTDEEHVSMCADTLPKQLACKKEFCAAMVKLRTAGGMKGDPKAMEAKCLEEIAVDGSGSVDARKARCAAWAKERPKMTMARADAREMDACWTKATCGERVDCWMPHMAKVMEKGKPAPAKTKDAAPKK